MRNSSELAAEFMRTRKMPLPIIDAHAHMGANYGTYMSKASAEGMLEIMDRENIESVFCAPHSALFDPGVQNKEIEEVMEKYPGRFKGYFTFNPNYSQEFEKNISRVMTVPGYIGFKFLPTYHHYPIDGANYRPALEFADRHGLPILIHTWGNNDPHNGPRHIEKAAGTYKNAIFIMGHSAPGELDGAISVAKRYENVYLDLCDIHRHSGIVDKMVKAIGADRVLFGTDIPWYDPGYGIGSVLFSHVSDEDKYKILYRNAKALAERKGGQSCNG